MRKRRKEGKNMAPESGMEEGKKCRHRIINVKRRYRKGFL